jgi:cysteine desulfurase
VTSPTPPGYFDANSGGPFSEVAKNALLKGIEHGWANPGRLHRPGRVANDLLLAARSSIANSLGFAPNEICFVQSVPLAFRLGLSGLLGSNNQKVVASKVEQSFILESLATLDESRVSLIDVDGVGRVDAQRFQEELAQNTVAALQVANHEVGTKQPWAEINFDIATNLTWFTDATLGPLSWFPGSRLPKRIDVAVLSPASWGGPLGVAVLAIRGGVHFKAQLGLGSEPRDAGELQSAVGEPNVGLALASAATLESYCQNLLDKQTQLSRKSRLLREDLTREIPDLVLLGDSSESGGTPGLVGFSLLYISGEVVLHELAKRDIAITSGSSCVANAVGPSHVLAAMGVLTQGNIRVSFDSSTSDADLRRFVQELASVVAQLREESGVTHL